MENLTAGQLIRQYRESEGLTQQELADIIHVSQVKLAHWEEDETVPNLKMVARLKGSLRLSDEKVKRLQEAVAIVRAAKAQKKAELQSELNEQNEEIERQQHKRKAWTLFLAGLLGFLGGSVFTFATGSYRDVWYFPFAVGVMTAGIPFGWWFFSRDRETYEPHYYYTNWIVDTIAIVVRFVLKLMLAYFVGVFAFPFALFYHAYKAGRKGSWYRKFMFVVFVVVSVFVTSILLIILLRSSN